MPSKNTSIFKSRFLSQNDDFSAFFDQDSNTSRFHKPQTTKKQINNYFSKNHNEILTQKSTNNLKVSEEDLIIRLTTSPKLLPSSTYSSSSFLTHTSSNDLERLERACNSSTLSQKQKKTDSFLPLSYTLYNRLESPKNNSIKNISSNIQSYENIKSLKKDASIKPSNLSEYFKLSTNVSPIYPSSDHIENYIPLPDLVSDSRASTSSSEESETKLAHSTPLYKVIDKHLEKSKEDSSHTILEEITYPSQDYEHKHLQSKLKIEPKNIFCKKSSNTIEVSSPYKSNHILRDTIYSSEKKKIHNISDFTMNKTTNFFESNTQKTSLQSQPCIKILPTPYISDENKYSNILKTQDENHQRFTKMLLRLQEELKNTIINVEELELKIQKFEKESKDRIFISEKDILRFQLLYKNRRMEIKPYISHCIKYTFFVTCIIFIIVNITKWALSIPNTYSELPLYQTWPT
ncbi:hypothetical protein PORY_000736 [Pneumocystis oryctolagi]|uniref:Uncharacterized protein n=1 Tax=Pneumocystis oryctolagi TaxID=42067 RepID=A0ACB7CDU3_9ASCO|nr:hypothetical protein PORY_000736 [Pneumocystis oryctolagi]